MGGYYASPVETTAVRCLPVRDLCGAAHRRAASFLRSRWPFGRYPFLLRIARAKERPGQVPPPGFSSIETTHSIAASKSYALFLHPDRLLAWFIAFALLMAGSLVNTDWRFLMLTPAWFVIVYFGVYHYLRRPVLKQAWSHWPDPLVNWFSGIPQRIGLGCGENQYPVWNPGKGVCQRTSRQPVNRFRDGSPQETFVRAALIDLFHHRTGGLWDHGFYNFILFWCTPAWTGYVWLWILIPFHRCTISELILPALVWGIVSTLFLVLQMRFLSSQSWGLTIRHLNRLPPQVQDRLERYTQLPDLVQTLSVRSAFTIVQTALIGVYLFTVRLLMG